jgi:hypothetical protein
MELNRTELIQTQNSRNSKLDVCKSGFLDFVHRLYFNKITTFRKLDLLPSSGKKKEGQKPQLVGPLVELASDLQVLPFFT